MCIYIICIYIYFKIHIYICTSTVKPASWQPREKKQK